MRYPTPHQSKKIHIVEHASHNNNKLRYIMGKSASRLQRQQPSAAITDAQDAVSPTMFRWKNLLIVTSGMVRSLILDAVSDASSTVIFNIMVDTLALDRSPKLLSIGPTLLLTLHAHADANQRSCVASNDSSLQCSSSKTWKDYLNESVEQNIEGNDEEQRKSEKMFRKMEKYLQR